MLAFMKRLIGLLIIVVTYVAFHTSIRLKTSSAIIDGSKFKSEVKVSLPLYIPFRVYKNEMAASLENMLNSAKWTKCKKVPKRIHQTWKDENIPGRMADLVKTWKVHHPDWEYWFWTDNQADEFIRTRFPNYYKMYRSYSKNIHRADAMRYFVLYEFGGLYVDLDTLALRPFDDLIRYHSALIPEDHDVHSKLYFDKDPYPLNAIMISAPGHPFFRQIIQTLRRANTRSARANVLYKTGPFMVDAALKAYAKGNQSTVSVCDAVYFPTYHDFVPEFDEVNRRTYARFCARPKISDRRRSVCNRTAKRNFTNIPIPKTAYTNHKFVHTYLAFKTQGKKPVPIKSIVSDYVNVSSEYSKLIGPNLSV